MISHKCYSNPLVLMMRLKALKDSSRGFEVSSEISFLINVQKTLPISGQIINVTSKKNYLQLNEWKTANPIERASASELPGDRSDRENVRGPYRCFFSPFVFLLHTWSISTRINRFRFPFPYLLYIVFPIWSSKHLQQFVKSSCHLWFLAKILKILLQ